MGRVASRGPRSRRQSQRAWIAAGGLAAFALGCAEADSAQSSATANARRQTSSAQSDSTPDSGAATTTGDAATTPDAAASASPTAQPPAPWPEPSRWTKAAELSGDRVVSKVRFLWIRPQAGPSKRWLGYLSLGDSVRVRGGRAAEARQADAPSDGDRCHAWYAVEPRGYVCVGGDATLDPSDPAVAELRATAAKPSSAWPYEYGESLGTPIYRDLPDAATQRRHEADLPAQLDKLRRLRAAQSDGERARIAPELAGVAIGPTGTPAPSLIELSPYGRGIRTRVWPGSTIAYTRSFDANGRSWLLTWDRGIVPADRVRPYPRVQFSGVPLTANRQLPIAFFRSRARPQYRLASSGGLEPTGKSWPRHGWVALTGRAETDGAVRYLETKDRQLYCAQADATVVRPVERIPETVARRSAGRRTWLDISVLGGWLVAYEGERPVYATLIAPGRGGVPFRGVPPIDTASTPTGQFTVTGKFVTATMASTSDANLVHSEVQYTQNFSGPHALHGAYWHDGWGEKMSGGCVNLSPIDSRRIFAWTDPPLPPGWHGVRWIPGQGESTAILIHR